MEFKAAICPSCGGKLQLPNDVKTVKCMYCGVDIAVREAVNLSGRVKGYTEAQIQEVEVPTLPNNELFNPYYVWGGVFLLATFLSLGISPVLSAFFAVPTLIIIIVFIIKNKDKESNQENTSNKPKPTMIIYEGLCPYCNSLLVIGAEHQAKDCPICEKRIVIRDSKFYSVDNPISITG